MKRFAKKNVKIFGRILKLFREIPHFFAKINEAKTKQNLVEKNLQNAKNIGGGGGRATKFIESSFLLNIEIFYFLYLEILKFF